MWSTSNTLNLCFYSPHFFLPLDAHIEFNWHLQVFWHVLLANQAI
jgi:hypothetical protein